MGSGASESGVCTFDKKKVSYFSKDLEGAQIKEKWPNSLESKDEQILIRIDTSAAD